MTLNDFLSLVKAASPIDLSMESLHRDFVHAIPDETGYKAFLDKVRENYPSSEHIAIMGSGNWKFSLNPEKNFSEFSIKSDIDIAIICRESFEETWSELREHHRDSYYLLSFNQRNMLKRHGENVYSGFVSPKWLPEKSKMRFAYSLNSNNYSNEAVGFRKINMMYFKNQDETLDYYKRGFVLAKKGN